MKPIDINEFREIAVDLLEAFMKVCEENNLRYLLDFGTLLGAIRHKGFIPWDDDIDISMPRADYEKLIKIAADKPDLFGPDYRLTHYNKLGYSIQKGYLNLVDTRTITYSPYRIPSYRYPIFIDIFPQDYCYQDKNKTEEVRKTVLDIQQTIRVSMCPSPGKGVVKALRRFYRMLCRFSIVGKFKKIEKMLISIPESDTVTDYYGEVPCYMDIKMFDNYIYTDFERLKCRIPADYDRRLTERFGDYMQLPPKEEQVCHFTEAYWL